MAPKSEPNKSSRATPPAAVLPQRLETYNPTGHFEERTMPQLLLR